MSRTAVAGAGLGVFASVTVAEHALRPELDPLRHQISEYAIGSEGWPMTIGFAAWAVALLAFGAVLRHHSRTGSAGFLLAAIGVVLIAGFDTQSVGGSLPRGVERGAGGWLHDRGGELCAAGLLTAAGAIALSRRFERRERWLAAATATAAVVISVALLALSTDTGGLRQRLVLLCACGWQASLLAWKREGRPGGRPFRITT